MPQQQPLTNPAAQAATTPLGMNPPNAPQQKQAAPAPKPKVPQGMHKQPQPGAPQQQGAPAPIQAAQGAAIVPNGQPPAGQPAPQGPQGPARSPPPKGVTRGQDAPIPGQSLTSKPGTYPYEKPPKFTDPDKAIASVLRALTEESMAIKVLNMLEVGVPVYTIVMTFIMNGFTEGQWNMDLALLLIEPMTAILIRMAQAADITPEIGVEEEVDETFEKVLDHRAKVNAKQTEAAIDAALSGGIMPRPKKTPGR